MEASRWYRVSENAEPCLDVVLQSVNRPRKAVATLLKSCQEYLHHIVEVAIQRLPPSSVNSVIE